MVSRAGARNRRRDREYFILIPIVLLIMLLPVTVSGLGTSQGAFVWLFGAIGVPVAAAVALSILFVTLGIVGNLPGGLLYVFGRARGAADGVKIAAAVLAVSVVVLSWVFGGGPAGLLYLVVYLLAVAPGLPVGFALFGRSHPAAWVCGALIGYGITQLALWTVIVAGFASRDRVSGRLGDRDVSELGVVVQASRWAHPDYTWSAGRHPRVAPGPAHRPGLDGAALQEHGARRRDRDPLLPRLLHGRFSLAHRARAELGKFTLPPRNPYLAPRVMNYYWTYFLLPSVVASVGPAPLRDVQACLKTNAFYNAVLMVGAVSLLVRTSVASAGPAAAAVVLAILAASVEGLYAIIDLVSRGRPLEGLTDMNIDAMTSWRSAACASTTFRGPCGTRRSIRRRSRSAWLAFSWPRPPGRAQAWRRSPGRAWPSVSPPPSIRSSARSVRSFTAWPSAPTHSPREGWRLLPRHAVAAVPVVLAVAWGAASKVVEGAGSALQFGFAGFSRNHPVLTLLLSVGPLSSPRFPVCGRCDRGTFAPGQSDVGPGGRARDALPGQDLRSLLGGIPRRPAHLVSLPMLLAPACPASTTAVASGSLR